MASDADTHGVIDAAQLTIALERLRTVSADVAEMKSSMVQMAGAVTRLAVMEERLGSSREALERAFREINDLQSRIKTIENAQPVQAQTTKWMNHVIGLVIAFVIGAVGTSIMSGRRDEGPQPVIERRQ